MTAIVLYGGLRKEFGERYDLDVSTVIEAVRALCALKCGFRKSMSDGWYRVVYGPLDEDRDSGPTNGIELDETELALNVGSQAIYIIPVLGGAKRGGAGKMILGATIMVAAVAGAAFTGGASISAAMASPAFTAAGMSVSYGSIALFGASMMLSGISQMLSPTPKAPKSTDTDSTNSFLLGGQLNVYDQGGPVPLVYGRYRVGATLISASVDTVQIGV